MSKSWKDRRDAKRVPLPGLMQCCIDLKPGRMENEVYINRTMDVTALESFMQSKKQQGLHYTYFHAIMMAVAKTIYNRPKLNRFVKNRHMFEHNDVSLAFVAKMELSDRSEEIMLLVTIDPDDTMQTISEKIAKRVENLRGSHVDKKGANSAIDVLGKLPNFIRVPIFGVIKWMDRVDLLPAELCKDNIYFSSMIISNLGSIRCGAIYHNLANFGTSSSLASMGEIKPQEVLMPDGTKQIRKVCEFGVTLDERVADGYYFAKSCKMIEYILQHPQLLEEPANTPVQMEELVHQ